MNPEALRRRVVPQVPSGPATVALSGGADSATLAWVVAERREIEALTIDHGLPGSAALVAAAQQIAAALGLPHEVVAVTPRSASEGDLRVVRLAALEAHATGWILTGHTAADQAETVLGNLLRGTGTGGLAGIPARYRRFVRPMLDIPRSDTRAVATELGLPFVDDPQNDDPAVRRNRLRHDTIPSLASAYNPRLQEALLRTARAAVADDEVLEQRAAAVPVESDEEAVLIPAAALTGLPAAVAARVARRALRMISGEHAGDSAAIAGILAASAGIGSGTIPGGMTVRREGPWVAVTGAPPPVPAPVPLPVPGEVPFGTWFIGAGTGPVHVPLQGPALVRANRPGDRIDMRQGRKQVADVLREAGVPSRLRWRWPVVEDHGRIVWVVGMRVAPAAGGPLVAMTARRERR